ncbi:unnamed protein product [Caenorhabditis bovis]|uniref:Dendritic cell-specific transmembrane protein-like domain-containing protein n=1 Tax=Caenorhabditis bovis TaxID=2654633 RepID=A0A8S1E3V0_9PELO|nr:unnamed protein product [Caenorhabditis bovis]
MDLYKLWKVKRNAQNAVNKFEFVVNNIKREHTMFLLLRNIFLVESFGLVMYFLMSFKYSYYPEFIGTLISIIIHFFLILTLIFPKMMSYFIIAIHMMLSTKVKNIILILIVAISFEGPAMNVVRNIHQVASGVACIQANVMASKNDVEGNIADKGQLLVSRLRAVLRNVAGPMNKVKRMLLTLDEKATKFVDIMRKHFYTISELTAECKNLLKTPYVKCLDVFDDAYTYCKVKARFFGLHEKACTAIPKTAAICHQAQGFSSQVCSLPNIFAKGVKGAAVPFYSAYFGAIEFAIKKIFYIHIEATKWAIEKVKPAYEEIKKASRITVQYETSAEGKPNAADDSTANLRASVKNSLMGIVNFYTGIISFISLILRYGIMPIIILWPFITALKFIYNFNYEDDYKNNFITDEFVKIDESCSMKGVKKVLPLIGDETKKYIWRTEWKMKEEEVGSYHLQIFITIISCVTPFFLSFLDIGVYTSIYKVYQFMNRTNVEVPAHYEVKVAGDSYMSQIMNEFMDVFSPFTQNVRERENKWRTCFQEPAPPNYYEDLLMFLLFVFALFLCRLKVFLGRQSLTLADHFYPHRVRIRALTLYSKIMQERHHLLAEMMHLAEGDTQGADDLVFRRSIQSRGHLRVNCSKCDRCDIRVADQANLRICIHCSAFYCIDCFSLSLHCSTCDLKMQNVNGIELYYEDDSEADDAESGN